MKFPIIRVLVGAALGLILLTSQANAHWCDDIWSSSYNIVVRPESDTVTVPSSGSANLNIFVQNNMGYQLINFKLSAKIGSTSITPTAPSTLKVANTLLPGEKGTWVLPVSKSGGGSVKIEDITFSVSFGNTGQSKCYPLSGGSPVMVVKTDKSLVPTKPAGLDSPAAPSGCTGDLAQGRDLQYGAIAEFEDLDTGLDKLMNFYCAGRGSWGATDGVSPSYCKDATSTTCPSSKPTGVGTKYQYIHLWASGELAARKSALGDRATTLRARLQCGVNDGDVGFAGYALMMLGYLGEDAGARTFIENVISTGSGDMVGIAKAAILLMGSADDMTKYKADVTSGLKASSSFVAAASAAALGIAAQDDSSVTGTLIPLVKWNEPDVTSEDGKGMFAAHLLSLVAWNRRGWVGNGADVGPISFYGDTGTPSGTGGSTGPGAGGASGAGGAVGGATGGKDAGPADAKGGTGGALASGGMTGNPGAGGNGTVKGGASGGGGTGAPTGSGGSGAGTGPVTASGGGKGSGTSSAGTGGSASGQGGDTEDPGTGGATTANDSSSGCKCNLGGPATGSTFSVLVMAGLALAALRRRRRG